MIRKGQKLKIKPEWQDTGDAELVFVALSDEEKGRLDISPLDGYDLTIRPIQTVRAECVEPIEGGERP